MILLADVGNTSLKWAWQTANVDFRVDYTDYDPESLAALLSDCWGVLEKPERVVVANVAGEEVGAIISAWCMQCWSLKAEFVCSEAECRGVVNAYPEPERLGVDRWLALLAIGDDCPRPVLVIDAGSAVTVDVMASGGRHLGGLIIPGVELMRMALEDYTPISLDGSETSDIQLLARDTYDAVIGGTLYAVAAFIDRVRQDVTQSLGEEPVQVISGGFATQLQPLLATEYEYRPYLVLEGLQAYLEEAG